MLSTGSGRRLPPNEPDPIDGHIPGDMENHLPLGDLQCFGIRDLDNGEFVPFSKADELWKQDRATVGDVRSASSADTNQRAHRPKLRAARSIPDILAVRVRDPAEIVAVELQRAVSTPFLCAGYELPVEMHAEARGEAICPYAIVDSDVPQVPRVPRKLNLRNPAVQEFLFHDAIVHSAWQAVAGEAQAPRAAARSSRRLPFVLLPYKRNGLMSPALQSLMDHEERMRQHGFHASLLHDRLELYLVLLQAIERNMKAAFQMSRRARRSASMVEYLRCIQEHLHLGQTLMQSGHTAASEGEPRAAVRLDAAVAAAQASADVAHSEATRAVQVKLIDEERSKDAERTVDEHGQSGASSPQVEAFVKDRAQMFARAGDALASQAESAPEVVRLVGALSGVAHAPEPSSASDGADATAAETASEPGSSARASDGAAGGSSAQLSNQAGAPRSASPKQAAVSRAAVSDATMRVVESALSFSFDADPGEPSPPASPPSNSAGTLTSAASSPPNPPDSTEVQRGDRVGQACAAPSRLRPNPSEEADSRPALDDAPALSAMALKDAQSPYSQGHEDKERATSPAMDTLRSLSDAVASAEGQAAEASGSAAAAACDVDFSIRFGDEGTDANKVSEPPCERFRVRGPRYFEDRLKVPATCCALRLLGADLLFSRDKQEHVAQGAVASKMAALTSRGDDVLLINFQCPQKSGALSVLLYWALTPQARADVGFMSLWAQFLQGDDAFCNAHLKLIPTVVEGNFIVRKLVGSRPAMLGGVKTRYHKGDGYVEADVDIAASGTAANLWRVVENVAKTLVIDLGFVLEAKETHLLPERLMSTVRFHRIDLCDTFS